MILWISPQNEDKRNHELESFDANNYQVGRENEGSHSHGAACLSLSLYRNKWLLLPTSAAWATRRRLQFNWREGRQAFGEKWVCSTAKGVRNRTLTLI
jgi:hypothetical protein